MIKVLYPVRNFTIITQTNHIIKFQLNFYLAGLTNQVVCPNHFFVIPDYMSFSFHQQVMILKLICIFLITRYQKSKKSINAAPLDNARQREVNYIGDSRLTPVKEKYPDQRGLSVDGTGDGRRNPLWQVLVTIKLLGDYVN